MFGSSLYIKYIDPLTNLPRVRFIGGTNFTIKQIEKGVWSVIDVDDNCEMGLYFDMQTAEQALDVVFAALIGGYEGADLINLELSIVEKEGDLNDEDIEE